jgi:hypothetical protein
MRLPLSEDIVLLGIDDDKGTIVLNASPDFPVCISAAMLTDMYLEGNLEIDNGKLIKVNEPHKTYLKTAFDKLPLSEDIDSSLGIITNKCDPLDNVVEVLTDSNVLSRSTKKVLFLKKEMYPTENPDPENATRYNLFQTVFEGKQPDSRMLFLLLFIKAGNLVSEVFRSRKDEALDLLDQILEKNLEQVLTSDQIKYFNGLIRAMQKRMSVSLWISPVSS